MKTLATLTLMVLLGFSMTAEAAPVKFEAAEITGEVQKPEIAIYIGRENLSKAYLLTPLKESFLSKITEALKKPPF